MRDYEVEIVVKNIKNIILRVPRLNLVRISLPKFVKKAVVDELLDKKDVWIKARFAELENKQKAKNYAFYLGKKYNLILVKSDFNELVLSGENIIIKHKNDDAEQVLYAWYENRAKELFRLWLDELSALAKKEVKSLKIRRMKSRWGSCNSAKSYINLNLELIKYDPKAIKAVIMHELAHLYYANHSKSFYQVLLGLMPEYYDAIKLLKNDAKF